MTNFNNKESPLDAEIEESLSKILNSSDLSGKEFS